MKIRNTILCTVIPLFIALFIFSGCSDSGDGTATIVINLGKNKSSSSLAKAIIDNPSAPSGISEININVTGPGIFLLSKKIIFDGQGTDSVSSDGTVSMEIPAGEKRLVEVIMKAEPGQYLGTATVDLESGTTVDVPILMKVNYFKLVIPDYMNRRIVRIDDMSGSGWITRDGNSILGPDLTLYPNDLEQDRMGRIFIAHKLSNSKIIRLDYFNAPSVIVASLDNLTVEALAVDSKRKKIYFATSSSLFSCNLNAENLLVGDLFVYDSVPINIQGMAVDESTGYLYMACGSTVVKYNPHYEYCTEGCTYGEVLNSTTDYLSASWDVMIKGSSVYVANYSSYNILQFSKTDLTYITSSDGAGGEILSKGAPQSVFYGPHRFVGILNRKIYVINDNGGMNVALTAMDNIAGDGWQSYGQHGNTGNGEGFFKFYSNC